MTDRCPECGSPSVYNSGFTIECATRSCSFFSEKQSKAVWSETIEQLKMICSNFDWTPVALHLEASRQQTWDMYRAMFPTTAAAHFDSMISFQLMRARPGEDSIKLIPIKARKEVMGRIFSLHEVKVDEHR